MDTINKLISDEELEPVTGGYTADDYFSCPRCGVEINKEDTTEATLFYFTCDCGRKYTIEQFSDYKNRGALEPVCYACKKKLPLWTHQLGPIQVYECWSCGAHIGAND